MLMTPYLFLTTAFLFLSDLLLFGVYVGFVVDECMFIFILCGKRSLDQGCYAATPYDPSRVVRNRYGTFVLL